MMAEAKRQPIAGESSDSVCVIIAAKNAADTIRVAISSALGDAHVTEVIVVDDGSTDDTSDVARDSDDESGRLRIIRFDSNKGPSYARNQAIAASSASLISILDADDFFLPGRFSHLLATKDWDLAADNIVFIDQERLSSFDPSSIKHFPPEPRFLDLPAFVTRNISRRGRQRGELGFLKPVMRRDFLDRHGLRYNEKLRLGEDYDLYARALALGGRFQIINHCGYGAVVRSDSLSGQHRTDDLKQLADADKALLEGGLLSGAGEWAVRQHERHIRGKYHHRRFLDTKAQGGFGAAFAYCLKYPSAVFPVACGVLTDKFDGLRQRPGKKPDVSEAAVSLRYLFNGSAAE